MTDDALYQDRILELAKAGQALPRLETPDATARVDNPICGDRVTLDFKLEGGAIVAVGAKVQGAPACNGWTFWQSRPIWRARGMPCRGRIWRPSSLCVR